MFCHSTEGSEQFKEGGQTHEPKSTTATTTTTLHIANLYVLPLHGGSRLADKLVKELPEPTHLLLRRRPGHNLST